MSSRHLWAGGVVLGLALGSVACDVKVGEGGGLSVDFAAGKASDEWVRTYDIKPGGRLEIININGQIRCLTGDGHPGRGPGHPRGQDRQRGGLARDASRRARCAKRSPRTGSRLKRQKVRGAVAADSAARSSPSSTTCGCRPGLNICSRPRTAKSVSRTSKAFASRRLTTNGGITGRGVSGAVEAQTVNGGIQMDLESVTGESRMVTVNGGVMLTVAPGVNADLEATVVNGGMSSAGRTSAVSRRAEPPASCRSHRKWRTSRCRADDERRRSTSGTGAPGS